MSKDNLLQYTAAELYADTIVRVVDGSCPSSVALTLGKGKSEEQITLNVNELPVFDELEKAVVNGRRLLAAKLDQYTVGRTPNRRSGAGNNASDAT